MDECIIYPDGTPGGAEDLVLFFYIPLDGMNVTFDTCPSMDYEEAFNTTLYLRRVCNKRPPPAQMACDEMDDCGESDGTFFGKIEATLNRGIHYLFLDGFDYTADPPPERECGEAVLDVSAAFP